MNQLTFGEDTHEKLSMIQETEECQFWDCEKSEKYFFHEEVEIIISEKLKKKARQLVNIILTNES